ncbi:hypothetical protein HY945_05600, partial [Candidatus Gottesmanbacteria bacterium]|nr:hypothetical protein [Candidatus Gottesmanbacteria bacterium]
LAMSLSVKSEGLSSGGFLLIISVYGRRIPALKDTSDVDKKPLRFSIAVSSFYILRLMVTQASDSLMSVRIMTIYDR